MLRESNESNKLLHEESDNIRVELQRSMIEMYQTKACLEPTEHKCHKIEVANETQSA